MKERLAYLSANAVSKALEFIGGLFLRCWLGKERCGEMWKSTELFNLWGPL